MAGRRILYLTALVGCTVFYCFYREWFSWFVLVLLLLLPWFSLICSLPALLTARGVIRCPDTVSLGQTAAAGLDILCTFPAPPRRGKLRITNTVTGQSRVVKSGDNLPTEVCGQLKAEPVRPRMHDWLGLFRFPLRKVQPASVIVFPKPVPIDKIPDFARLPARQWKPRHGGGFSENHELRLYRPGDSLQQIHWKLSAKTGKLIFREAMEPVRRRVLLTVDLSGSHEELNRKLGQLLWLSRYLLEKELHFEISALTGLGCLHWPVETADGLDTAMTALLSCPAAASGSLAEDSVPGARQFHIGGDRDEA